MHAPSAIFELFERAEPPDLLTRSYLANRMTVSRKVTKKYVWQGVVVWVKDDIVAIIVQSWFVCADDDTAVTRCDDRFLSTCEYIDGEVVNASLTSNVTAAQDIASVFAVPTDKVAGICLREYLFIEHLAVKRVSRVVSETLLLSHILLDVFIFIYIGYLCKIPYEYLGARKELWHNFL